MSALLRPKFGSLDPAALAKAEAALSSLSGQFDAWLDEEVSKLKAAHHAVLTDGLAGAAGEKLHNHAHDLKGLGGTYGYPIVTRIAGSLCNLVSESEARGRAPMALVTAHVDAIRTVVERQIRTDEDPAGRALALALEAGVTAQAGG